MSVKNKHLIIALWAKRGLIASLLLLLAAIGTWIIFTLVWDIPSISELKARTAIESTKIYDKTGKVLLYEVYNEEKRTIIKFEDIPRDVKNATIAIEDSNFYKHIGINPFAIIRSFVTDIMHGRFLYAGGSTITQQLVKNALLSPEKTLTRKLKEAVIALKMEQAYSKDEILNLYLNEIPYGSNAYGIEAAAQTFFGKPAPELTLAEAAYLAAMPKAPSYYSPYGNHFRELQARKDAVLERMADIKYISREDAARAKEEKVTFLPNSQQGIRAPHFVMYVIEQLNEKYGEDYIKNNGLKVITSLDMDLQTNAEESVTKYAADIERNFNAGNTGLVAIDPKNGGILAMVGSRDYFDIEREGNFNVALAPQEPGSAFKPLVYASAFEKGYTPETVLFDVPTEFAVQGATSYRPGNYDDQFRGPMSLREALAQSINIPAVKVLYLNGVKNAIQFAQKMGITTLTEPDRYGLSLVLGGGGVKLLELTSAYGVFANDGVRHPSTAILSIEKYDGEVLLKLEDNPQQVISPQIARQISSILSDNIARTPAFGSNSALYFPERPVAAKTGTTNEYRDAWIIGYTPNIAVGAWAGNNDNAPMEKRVAGFIVAPIWHDFMAKAFSKLPVEEFTAPAPEVVDKPILRGEWGGGLSSSSTPQNVHTILYWVDKNNPRGPIPGNPWSDSQFQNWEFGVQQWVSGYGGKLPPENATSTPGFEPDGITGTILDAFTGSGDIDVKIESPRPNSKHDKDMSITVRTDIESDFPIARIEYFVNGHPAGINRDTGQFQIDLSDIDDLGSRATITVRASDEKGNSDEAAVNVRITN